MIAEACMYYLEAKGKGTVNTDLFLGFQPDKPDNCVTIYDTVPPLLPESQGLKVDHVTCQVLVRNQNYMQARDILAAIHRDIVGYSGPMGGFNVTVVYIETPPGSLGRDEKGRAEWSAHYRFRVESEGDTHRI